MERDPATGRFLPGNKIALGNKGNQNSKWGNKNAQKHGWYSTVKLAKVLDDGCLWIYMSQTDAIRVQPNQFHRDENGNLIFNEYTASIIEKLGLVIKEV